MKQMTRQFLWVSIFAAGMALLEAVVVAYLRALLDVTKDYVSLGPYVRMEVWREVATILMLVAVGWMAGEERAERWAYGLFAFGLWDIFYYVWLKVLLGWPETVLDWDLLFLIPLRWWGPVLAPVCVAVLLCVAAVLAVKRLEQGERLGITSSRVTTLVVGGVLALYIFMSDSLHALLAGKSDWGSLRPGPFKWPLFLVALVLMAVPSLMATCPVDSILGPLRSGRACGSEGIDGR